MGESKLKAEAKRKKFEENPENFLDKDEVIMAVEFDHDKQLDLFVNGDYINQFPAALGLLIIQVPRAELFFKQQMAQIAKNRILTPGGDNGKIIA